MKVPSLLEQTHKLEEDMLQMIAESSLPVPDESRFCETWNYSPDSAEETGSEEVTIR